MNGGRWSPCGVAANVLLCDIIVDDFEPQLHQYVHFRINILSERNEPSYLPIIGLIVPLLFLALNNPQRLIYH